MNCTYQKIKGTMNWNLKRGLFYFLFFKTKRGLFSSLNFGNDRCSEGLYQTQGMLWPFLCAIVVRLLNKSNSMHTINLSRHYLFILL